MVLRYLLPQISHNVHGKLQKKYPQLLDHFDGLFMVQTTRADGSLYTTKAKPNVEYYRGLREYLTNQKCDPEIRIIFIDDNQNNINGAIAAQVGIEAVRFTSLAQLKKDLAQYLSITN
jgi:FMN phosphatase YigB (HAD superfamily)